MKYKYLETNSNKGIPFAVESGKYAQKLENISYPSNVGDEYDKTTESVLLAAITGKDIGDSCIQHSLMFSILLNVYLKNTAYFLAQLSKITKSNFLFKETLDRKLPI